MDIVIGSAAAAIVVASWVIAARLLIGMSRDLAALSQRVARLEGRTPP